MKCMEKAYAKVNLTLQVGSRRPDGYHAVMSVMQRISLWDTVTVERGTGHDTLLCSVPVTESVDDNLCMKAARAFFVETGTKSDGVTITLEKHIPVQAGLGGGSSDAAAVLRALRTLYAPDISGGRLETLAARLGSDVPFFIRGGTQLATGRGEVVSPLPQLAAGWFVVMKPDEGYSRQRCIGGWMSRVRCWCGTAAICRTRWRRTMSMRWRWSCTTALSGWCRRTAA